MIAKEVSNAVYAASGINDPFHNLSHHSEVPANIERYARLNAYHTTHDARVFPRQAARHARRRRHLLDHSLVLYGSGMSNSNQHDHEPLPTLVAGGASGALAGGRHIRAGAGTPFANLLVALLAEARRRRGVGSATARASCRCESARGLPAALLAFAAARDRREGRLRDARRRRDESRQRGRAHAARARRRCQRARRLRHAGSALGRARRGSHDGRAAARRRRRSELPERRKALRRCISRSRTAISGRVELLLDAGADAQLLDQAGETPLMLAARAGERRGRSAPAGAPARRSTRATPNTTRPR